MPAGFGSAVSEAHGQARGAQASDAVPVDARVGVAGGDDDLADAGVAESVDAGRGAPARGTGLKRDVESRAAELGSRPPRIATASRVRAAGRLGSTLTHDGAVADEHRSGPPDWDWWSPTPSGRG